MADQLSTLAIAVAAASATFTGVGAILQAYGVRSLHKTNAKSIEAARETALNEAKRDATAKITEAYVRFNQAVLTNERAFDASRQYLWHHNNDDSFVNKRTFWSLLLNTVYIEYKFSQMGLVPAEGFIRTATVWGRGIGRSDCDSFIVFLDDVPDFDVEFRDVFRQAALSAAQHANAVKLGVASGGQDPVPTRGVTPTARPS